jgi:hypothetical protein
MVSDSDDRRITGWAFADVDRRRRMVQWFVAPVSLLFGLLTSGVHQPERIRRSTASRVRLIRWGGSGLTEPAWFRQESPKWSGPGRAKVRRDLVLRLQSFDVDIPLAGSELSGLTRSTDRGTWVDTPPQSHHVARINAVGGEFEFAAELRDIALLAVVVGWSVPETFPAARMDH